MIRTATATIRFCTDTRIDAKYMVDIRIAGRQIVRRGDAEAVLGCMTNVVASAARAGVSLTVADDTNDFVILCDAQTDAYTGILVR